MIDSLFNMLLFCSHRRTTFPLTTCSDVCESSTTRPHKRTYVVCLDCGKEFPYDWKEMRIELAAGLTDVRNRQMATSWLEPLLQLWNYIRSAATKTGTSAVKRGRGRTASEIGAAVLYRTCSAFRAAMTSIERMARWLTIAKTSVHIQAANATLQRIASTAVLIAKPPKAQWRSPAIVDIRAVKYPQPRLLRQVPD